MNLHTLKVKFKRLLVKILLAIVIIVLIYCAVKILSLLIKSSGKEPLTEKEQRVQKYNQATFGEEEIPEDKLDSVIDIINQYYNYCNKKDYENAYALLTEDCKAKSFPTIEDFKLDVDEKFDKLKLYRYKNLLNIGDMYIYNFILYDDIIAYGTNETPIEKMYYLTINNKGGTPKLALNGYIETEDINYASKYKQLKISTVERQTYYSMMNLDVIITNESDELALVYTNDIDYIIKSKSGKEVSFGNINNLDVEYYLLIKPHTSRMLSLSFDKYFDTTINYNDYMLRFNNIYFMNNKFYEDTVLRLLNKNSIEKNATEKFNMNIAF